LAESNRLQSSVIAIDIWISQQDQETQYKLPMKKLNLRQRGEWKFKDQHLVYLLSIKGFLITNLINIFNFYSSAAGQNFWPNFIKYGSFSLRLKTKPGHFVCPRDLTH
jgi:hypothetical protein